MQPIRHVAPRPKPLLPVRSPGLRSVLGRMAIACPALLLGCGADEGAAPNAAEPYASSLTVRGVTGELVITNDWGAGYCATVRVANGTTAAAATWKATLALGTARIYSSWNGVYSASTGSVVVTPVSWGATLAPGQTRSDAGFCANRPSGTSSPTVTDVRAYDAAGREIGADGSGGSGGTATGGTATGGTATGGTATGGTATGGTATGGTATGGTATGGTGGPTCSPTTYEAETILHTVGGVDGPGWNLWSNGAVYTQHTFAAGAHTVSVVARGTPAAGVWPRLVVKVGGREIGAASVTSTSYATYRFTFTATAGAQRLSLDFTNDHYAPPEDRNLIVDKLTVACTGGDGAGSTGGATGTGGAGGGAGTAGTGGGGGTGGAAGGSSALKDLAGSMWIGARYGGSSTDVDRRILLGEFNAGQPAWYTAWGGWNGVGDYDFSDLNASVTFLYENGRHIDVHMMVGPNTYLPDWVIDGTFTNAELDGMLRDLIRNMIQTNSNATKVDVWNVVNEAVNWEGNGWETSKWLQLGYEADASGLAGSDRVYTTIPVYVRKAFEYARQYTSRDLELRDYDNEGLDRVQHTKAFYQLVKHLKAKGAPVTAVGLQAHLNLDTPYDFSQVDYWVARYKALGLKVFVTEMDTEMTSATLTSELAARQRTYYHDYVAHARAAGVDGVFFWGIRDNQDQGWRLGDCALLFDEAGNPKPAYYGVQDALSGR